MESINTMLDKVELLATSSKLMRLTHAPFKYLNGQLFSKIVYPFLKQGKPVTCRTFFNEQMNLLLPAAMDIYLCGGKTHDSEIRLSRFIVNTLKQNDVFIDIGAHFGFYSLLASQLVGTNGSVISIEASNEIFRILNKNTCQHANIQSFNIVCSDRNEMMEFHEFPMLFSEYNSISPGQYEGTSWFRNNKPHVIQAEGKTIDSLLTQLKTNPDFIKIDVEGAEREVIDGMTHTLDDSESLIISMEYHADSGKNKAHKEAANILMNKNYLANIVNKKGKLERISTSGIGRYLLNSNLDSDNIIFRRA
ncbi:MAG: FkbM family methyltransferase [Bacteroidetes bacterium]|nr:FkbM family methyltransferase [Bacteroidota bacterium]